MLPTDQATRLLSLWREFEAAETAEAKFAKAFDRLQPLLLNTLLAAAHGLRIVYLNSRSMNVMDPLSNVDRMCFGKKLEP